MSNTFFDIKESVWHQTLCLMLTLFCSLCLTFSLTLSSLCLTSSSIKLQMSSPNILWDKTLWLPFIAFFQILKHCVKYSKVQLSCILSYPQLKINRRVQERIAAHYCNSSWCCCCCLFFFKVFSRIIYSLR